MRVIVAAAALVCLTAAADTDDDWFNAPSTTLDTWFAGRRVTRLRFGRVPSS